MNRKGKVRIFLDKDRRFYPDYLYLRIENIGKNDVDIDRPLITFENILSERKFRIRGTNRYSFYPLYLDSGKTHKLEIELRPFYQYDRKLKRLPKVSITVFDVQNRKLGKKSIRLRKTLFFNA
jgi:hypothetical protein